MHTDTQEIIALILRYRYFILFPVALVEGPAVAVIAGFMVAIGFMSFLPVYIILVSANILGDIIYYFLGFLLPRRILIKVLSFLRISEKRVTEAEKLFVKHKKRAIIIGKVAHAVGSIFLIAAGLVKVPLREYLEVGTLIELPKALFFLLIGFYFGRTISNLDRVVEYSLIGFIIITALIFIAQHLVDKRVNEVLKQQK